jgi:hypothetical protein
MAASEPPTPEQLAQFATQVMESPNLLRRLSDLVYNLLQAELREQRDRSDFPYRR